MTYEAQHNLEVLYLETVDLLMADVTNNERDVLVLNALFWGSNPQEVN